MGIFSSFHTALAYTGVVIMVRTTRITFVGITIIVVAVLTLRAGSLENASAADLSPGAHNVQHAYKHVESFYLPLSKFHLRGIDGPYHTQGNLILGADNRPYLFHGVARDDLEYLCAGDGHYTEQELAYMGSGDNTAHATYWGGNIVRLPLSENFWLYGSPSQRCSPAQYHAVLKRVVDTLTSLNLNVMLDLQWTNAGGQAPGAGDAWAMPDQDSVTLWQQVAGIYKNYRNVLLEIYNEPHWLNNWPCWRNGCAIVEDSSGLTGHDHSHYSYQAVGMQTLLDTVRQTGADNLVVVGGVDWGFDLSQLPTYHLNGTNIVYDTHPYSYKSKLPAHWDAAFGQVSATYPVISAESGEYDCKTAYVSQLFSYFDAHDIGWISWAWAPPWGDACKYPRLVTDLTGKPTPEMGQFVYQYLHSYLALLASEEIPARLK